MSRTRIRNDREQMNDREHMSDCSPRSPRDCQAGKRTHPSLVRVIPEAQSAKLLLLPQKRGKHDARHMTYVIACHNLTMCSVKKDIKRMLCNGNRDKHIGSVHGATRLLTLLGCAKVTECAPVRLRWNAARDTQIVLILNTICCAETVWG